MFGGKTYRDAGKPWWEYGQIPVERMSIPLSIAFAFVATHNHFVLDRGGKVFNRSAPIIKLPPEATEEDLLALLGYLNSSTACFWMKQVFFDKGNRGEGGGTTSEAWERFYEHDGTKIKQFPLPQEWRSRPPVLFSARLDALGRKWAAHQFDSSSIDRILSDAPSRRALSAGLVAQDEQKLVLEEKIRWLQEELDWAVYAVWGLCEASLATAVVPPHLPRLRPGYRPSDIRFAKRVLNGDVGRRFFELCRLPPPEEVAGIELDGIAARRAEAIESSRKLSLLEQPEFKRTFRESFRPTDAKKVLRIWLLDRIESTISTSSDPTPRTTRQLARDLQHDPKLRAVAEVCTDSVDPDLESLFTDLVASDAVPFVAPLRYKPPGLKKHRAWQHTWDTQRREDFWEAADPATRGPPPPVPPPPQYKNSDVHKPPHWRKRGKLDVPKERFISYPGLADADDACPVLGWAGWDHADRMAALGQLTERHGGDPERLKPLLAGMYELLPWVQQWHGDDMRYGTPLGELWAGHLEGLRLSAGLSMDEIEGWQPPRKTRARGRKPGKPRKPPPARAALVAALEALLQDSAAGVTRKDLAAHLGCSQPMAGKAAQPLLDDGTWKLVKQRPITYAPGDA